MAHVNIPQAKLDRAFRYANLLRTTAERTYASSYVAWLRNGAEGLEPTAKRVTKRIQADIRQAIDAMKLWES